MILFGWGSQQIEFKPPNGTIAQHVCWTWTERGGYDASPTGVIYQWTSEPEQLPGLISRLQEIQVEYEKWKAAALEQPVEAKP